MLFVNDDFAAGTINKCKLQPFTNPTSRVNSKWVVALPGVRILSGEELYVRDTEEAIGWITFRICRRMTGLHVS